jgi:hypothetical protein
MKIKMHCGVSHEDAKHATRYKIVYGLMNKYKNKNYIVTCDNFFSSFTLFWNLENWGACHKDL